MGILHRQAIFTVRRRVRRERRVGLIEYSYDGESLRYTECNVLDIGNPATFDMIRCFSSFLLSIHAIWKRAENLKQKTYRIKNALQISECFHIKKKKKKNFLISLQFFSFLPCYETFILLLYYQLVAKLISYIIRCR